jgi:hypothetical protein
VPDATTRSLAAQEIQAIEPSLVSQLVKKQPLTQLSEANIQFNISGVCVAKAKIPQPGPSSVKFSILTPLGYSMSSASPWRRGNHTFLSSASRCAIVQSPLYSAKFSNKRVALSGRHFWSATLSKAFSCIERILKNALSQRSNCTFPN